MKDHLIKKAGEKLVCLRSHYNLSQETLGIKLGITQGHISSLESGRKPLTASVAYLILEAFKVPMNVTFRSTLEEFKNEVEINHVKL